MRTTPALMFAVATLANAHVPVRPASGQVLERLRGLAVPFVENQGQSDPRVAYYAPTLSGTVFVTRQGEIVYALPGPGGRRAGREAPAAQAAGWILKAGGRGLGLRSRRRWRGGGSRGARRFTVAGLGIGRVLAAHRLVDPRLTAIAAPTSPGSARIQWARGRGAGRQAATGTPPRRKRAASSAREP